MGKVIFMVSIKISGIAIAIFYFTGSNLVSSLTSKPRELDRFRPCFHAY